MINRPGRLYYALDFAGLSASFIAEYCADKLLNQATARGVQTVAAFFDAFSFDMLQALVEEMNRYDETASQAMALLNMRPQNEEDGVYEVKGLRQGVPLVCDGQSHDTVHRSPLGLGGLEVSFYGFDNDTPAPEGGLTATETVVLDVNNLLKVDLPRGQFVFATATPDVTVEFTRRRMTVGPMNYDAY